MQVVLSLKDPELADDELLQLTREVCLGLNREAPVEAQLVETPGEPGSKGDGSLPQIAMEIAMHASAVVIGYTAKDILFDLAKHLRTYFDRRPKLRMELSLPDGRNLAIEGSHVRPEEVERTALQLKDLLESSA